MTLSKRASIIDTKVHHDGWSSLKTVTYNFQRRDGQWQKQSREVFDCGHGVAILLYDKQRRTVILTRQFRCAQFLEEPDQLLIEAPAGMLDGAQPADRIKLEVEEETGYRVQSVKKVLEAYMSPGAVTQKIICFVGEYTPQHRVSAGGGLLEEGEDIEVLELDFDVAMTMIADGQIRDGKSIMLLQYAALNLFKAA